MIDRLSKLVKIPLVIGKEIINIMNKELIILIEHRLPLQLSIEDDTIIPDYYPMFLVLLNLYSNIVEPV